jgi:4-hydroxy-4-methyl-2-oxoglutarate aldolase
MLNDSLLERAARLSTASLHEAGGKIGALPSDLKPLAPQQRLCGRAFPVACPAGDNLFLHHAIYEARAGDVLVADTAGGEEFGYWGEIMAEAAHARSLAGLVITGGVRDSARLVEMGFPVFATRTCIRGTGKDPVARGAVGQPVSMGDVTIEPGDLVLGDADGLVVIPQKSAAEIVTAAEERDRKEADIIARLRAGESTLAIYNLPPLTPGTSALSGSRRSIHVKGLSHGSLPIPPASRLGRFIATGGVRGVDPETGVVPSDIRAQARNMFANLRRIIEAGGGRTTHIVKVTIWIATAEGRDAVNGPWLEMFPDPDTRPARHILNYTLPANLLLQCEALAVLDR